MMPISTSPSGSSLVFGCGGLLGSALVDYLESTDSRVFERRLEIPWSNPSRLRNSFTDLIKSFLGEDLNAPKFIYWAAGVANLRSSPEIVQADANCIRTLTSAVDDAMKLLRTPVNVTFCFSSSAGGVYGKSSDPPFHEGSATGPWSHYGESKLAQEQHLLGWSRERGVRCIIARITSLYGENQNMSKSQGFLSRLLANIAHRRPTRIFVPLQTTRNYVYVHDAAKLMVRHARSSFDESRLANICSSYDSALSNVIQTAKNITKLRVLTEEVSDSRFSHETLDLRVRSIYKELVDECCRTSLAAGTKHLFDSEIARLGQGRESLRSVLNTA